MIITKSMSADWLSNSWLIGDVRGGSALLIDSGAPMAPILESLREHELTLTHVLCTHHHHDHVEHNADYKAQFGCPICGHGAEAERFGDLDRELVHDEELQSGGLHVRALHIPGHTEGQLAFLVNETHVFTGDTLFRGSVGGTRAPGHATFGELQHSILEVLMQLPRETQVLPGHTDPSTIGREWDENPFIRAWTGRAGEDGRPCRALGKPATLLVEARDYDGGTKCQVRFEDSGGVVDLVPGSRVELL
jgi:hydroxyacylglutathione hydrolase